LLAGCKLNKAQAHATRFFRSLSRDNPFASAAAFASAVDDVLLINFYCTVTDKGGERMA